MRVVTFDSGLAGPRLLVTGAVHGDEIAGPDAQNQLIDEFQESGWLPDRGKLELVPVVNEEAYKARQRQIGENLNRVFCWHANPKTYEERLANEMVLLVKSSTHYLDIHSTHVEGDPPSICLDYDTPENRAWALALGIKTIGVGWPEMFKKEGRLQPGTTDCAQEYGVHSVLVECGSHNGPLAKTVALRSIAKTLAHLGMGNLPRHMSPNIERNPVRGFRFEEVVRYNGGRLVKDWKHMDEVKQGEVLAVCQERGEIFAPKDGLILIPNPHPAQKSEWFYHGSVCELSR